MKRLIKFVLLFTIALVWSDAATARKSKDVDSLLAHTNKRWTGDLDGIIKRGYIRVLSTYNPLFVGFDGKDVRGLTIDVGRAFEKHLRKTLGRKARDLHVIFHLVPRDELISGLVAGRGDIAIANLTITRKRKSAIEFSNPIRPDVTEVVVTGPGTPALKSFDQLVSVPIHVRASSSYYEHLRRLNQRRKRAGKPRLTVVKADEQLEDYDLLEMVNVGLIPAVIVDDHKVALWRQVFKKIKIHKKLAVNTKGKIAWAFRKKSPKLKRSINRFVRKLRKGTLLGNVLIERYLGSTEWIDNIRSPAARKRFEKTAVYFQRYARRYDFDWLMIAAQGYQESKFDQRKRSKSGAIGIMQVKKTTARDKNVNIRGIHIAERNVHAGVKYLRHLRDDYFNDRKISTLDRVLFSFAAYNAGPGAIQRARKQAKRLGFNPNRWFGHVEVAAARTVSREPVVYVRNILKYYIMYKRAGQIAAERSQIKRNQMQ